MIKTARSALFAAAIFSAGAAQAQEQLTFLLPAPFFLTAFSPYQLAQGQGYYADAGLEVNFISANGGADVATQVAVGNGDLGGGIGDTSIIMRANDVPVRGVALLGASSLHQFVVRNGAGIESPEDLAGQSIGTASFQDTSYYNLLALLAQADLTPADVDIQAVGVVGMQQLMVAGTVDVMIGAPEGAFSVEAAGVDLTMTPVSSYFPAMAQAILASDTIIAERPEVIAAFVEATLRAVREIRDDPAAAAAALDEITPVPPAVSEVRAEALAYYAEQVYTSSDEQPLGTFLPARVAQVQQFYLDQGIVTTQTPLDDLFTNDFVTD